MNRLIPTLMAGACAALAGCAPTTETAAVDEAAAATARQCFIPSQARNFRADGPGRVYVRANDNRVYQLSTSGGCFNLDSAHGLAITPDGAGMAGSRVCTGDWVRIGLSQSAAGPASCRAVVDKVLTEEEVAALPSASRP